MEPGNESASSAFRAFIADASFPCAGAKSALAQDNISFEVAGDLRDPHDDVALVGALQDFARDAGNDDVFLSKVLLFPATPRLDEPAFEEALWQRLQALHHIDAVRFEWDPAVSDDPDSPHFSLSIGRRGFYVVGLHPGASRPARRFPFAALVFNLHSQFEALRADGRYARLRDAITERDVAYSGSRNPMLAIHGEQSEARQYSGRRVDMQWRCPFAREAGRHDAA
ncbi:guanitoxin biosynthesis heme-dependent pre-guanitoxin N-hydroxylase GntA [Cognatiluteimonas profundi]|uniref:guanitoxin biosynthesis heme-dependent pre-guanitoxin N-hydroxylase GntA n=1 Tax=Cognatiluteimonas profundi TaxID=2594501 RepID=UPI00131E4202|nr:guanitoxin biosynthesis heme-dependent pre-guanitoxin N-hydroxylase GntA [Lysobacter profundi]